MNIVPDGTANLNQNLDLRIVFLIWIWDIISFKNHNFVALCKHNLEFQWKVCLSSKILEIFYQRNTQYINKLVCAFALWSNWQRGWTTVECVTRTNCALILINPLTHFFFTKMHVWAHTMCICTHTHICFCLCFFSPESYLKFIRGK